MGKATVVKVKAIRRILRELSKERGHLIRMSPQFVDTFDKQVKDEFMRSIERMDKSGRKTLMEQDAI